jgi:hypothetical protein
MRVFHNPNAFQRHIRSCGGKIKDKQLTVSRTENIKYLTCTDQMDKFKPTEYYIVFDFETMEELIDNEKEDITIELEDDSSSLSSSSSSAPTKSTEKISCIVLLSVAWATKTKSGVKTGYFDHRDG